MVDDLMMDTTTQVVDKPIDVVVDSPVGALQAIPENEQEEKFLTNVSNNDRSLDHNTKLILAFDALNKALEMASPTEAMLDLLPNELDDKLIELIEMA